MADIQPEPQYKKCPLCGEQILKEAVKCRYCKRDVNTEETSAKDEDGMSSSEATFFYSSIIIIGGAVLYFTKSINVGFIVTALYGLGLYLFLDNRHKH